MTLYPILDLEWIARLDVPGDLPTKVGRVAEAIVASSAPLFALQVRSAFVSSAASPDDRTLLACARAVVRAAARRIPVYVNDRPDLALLSGAFGVHLGRRDLPPEEVRASFPELLVGLSSHTPEEFREGLSLTPDLLAYGPVFATATKRDPAPVVGLADLPALAHEAAAAGVPTAAIGGITSARAVEIAATGVSTMAVALDLLPEGGDLAAVAARAAAYARALPAPAAPGTVPA